MNIENYIQENDYITIPLGWVPTEFYTISFSGWNKNFTFDINDTTLNEIVHMAAKTLDCFINLYKDERVFTDPILSIKEDGTFYVKIGTLEKEEYDSRMEKEKNDDSVNSPIIEILNETFWFHPDDTAVRKDEACPD